MFPEHSYKRVPCVIEDSTEIVQQEFFNILTQMECHHIYIAKGKLRCHVTPPPELAIWLIEWNMLYL